MDKKINVDSIITLYLNIHILYYYIFNNNLIYIILFYFILYHLTAIEFIQKIVFQFLFQKMFRN